MENMRYAGELVREYLVFRGFTNTLQSFEMELSTDIGKGFEVDKILDLVFNVYIPKFQAEKLVGLISFFKQCFSILSETVFVETLLKLEVSILRYYIVYAVQCGRNDRVAEFFGLYGNELVQRGKDWSPWFAIAYLKNPNLDAQFRVYFSKEWYDALHVSVRNFFSEVFNGTRIPALLKISSEKITVNHLKKNIKQLNWKLSQLQALLEEKETQLHHLRRTASSSGSASSVDLSTGQVNTSATSNGVHEEISSLRVGTEEVCIPTTSMSETAAVDQEKDDGRPAKFGFTTLTHQSESSSLGNVRVRESKDTNAAGMTFDGVNADGSELQCEEEFTEVEVDFQDTFLGHTSAISRCIFSASGNNIASASVDGTVRIWTYDSATPTSRNTTIYCGTEVMSVDWECKSDRLLLIGTADGGIKAWNIDAKRVVCDLNTREAFPSVLDLKCSPVEPIFVSAAASRRHGSSFIDSLEYAALIVWNMKTWRAMTVLSFGEDPPAITSVSFNHNGEILAAAAIFQLNLRTISLHGCF